MYPNNPSFLKMALLMKSTVSSNFKHFSKVFDTQKRSQEFKVTELSACLLNIEYNSILTSSKS